MGLGPDLELGGSGLMHPSPSRPSVGNEFRGADFGVSMPRGICEDSASKKGRPLSETAPLIPEGTNLFC
jgi:hypothetical protein